MPEDAKEAMGHGMRAKRSKSGAVSFDILEMEARRPMHRSSESVAAIATALAKAQTELYNPEKAMVGTVYNNRSDSPQTFRCASLSCGLHIVRKTLGGHKIAVTQTTDIDRTERHRQPNDPATAHLRRVDLLGLAGLPAVRDICASSHGCGVDLRPPVRSVYDGRDRRRG